MTDDQAPEAQDLEAPTIDLVAALVARPGVTVAHGATVDVIIVPRRFP